MSCLYRSCSRALSWVSQIVTLAETHCWTQTRARLFLHTFQV